MSLLAVLLSVVTFSQFTMREGLSQNSVFSITQDKDKNMWFATYEGINRFDGYNFTVYHLERDPDFVQVEGADQLVYADSKGRIWAYDGGLSRYEPATDRFFSMRDKLQGAVTSFLEIPGEKIVIVINGEMKVLDINTCNLLDEKPCYNGHEATVIDEGFGILAIGTRSGDISIFKSDDGTPVAEKSILSGTKIVDILVSSEHEIWATALGGHIFRCNLEDGNLQDYSQMLPPKTYPVLCRDRFDRLIIAAADGVYAYEEATDRFVLSFTPPDNPISLKSMFRDIEGDLWLGSFYKGVYYCHTDDNPFETISLGIPTNALQISCIGESPEGQLWIGTLGMGTFVYEPSTRQISRHKFKFDPSDAGIKKMFFSPDGKRIWFGLDGGLSEYNRRTGEHIVYSGKDYPRSVYSIIPAGEHKLWLGTLSGVYIFDTLQKKARKIGTSGNLFIYKLYEDKEDNLWVASESGLYRARISRRANATDCGTFEKESTAMDVHDILESGDKLIAAARNGLYIRQSTGEWMHYDRQSGLSSSFINGIEVDHAGILWIGTEYGLNRFDPSTEDFSRYFKEDGIGIDYFTKNAHCCASDGTVYFGGIGGLTRIDPTPRKKMQSSSTPRITDFVVNGTHQPFSENLLNYDENSISFRFSVTNYSSRQKNLFRYRLYGADNDWRISEVPFSDTYASLRPGEYRFELKSYNISGQESRQMAVFLFTIRPPWWASNIAIVIYFLLGLMLISFVIWRIDLSNKKRAQAEIDRITKWSKAGIDRLTVLHYTKDPVSPEDASFILKAVRTMERNLSNEAYGVEQLADDLCMSRSNLYLRIKKLTGDSVLQFIHKIRLEKACQLLRETQMSIMDIANETGFGSAAYFCTCFKREKGTTPNQWRQ